jgi:hypothetical protein
MTGEHHVRPEPLLVFLCRFVPARNECERTVRFIEARDADQALHEFAMQLSSAESAGWIDVLDHHTGALLRTRFYSH